MSDLAIRVDNLGKSYRIGVQAERPQSHWEAAKRLASSPFDYLRRATSPPSERETLWALRNVSFEVDHGEVVGLIGRNGAGKSTLLKILSRITEPTEGTADLYGRMGSLLEVGTGFHAELSGRENIYLSGAILGMKKAEIDARFDEIVDFAGVERFLDTPVKRYSSGMYVRLAFAVAAHLEPEILLIDEVLAVGDTEFQKKCLGKMNAMAREEGRTVLFVSHSMPAILNLCQRGILLRDGSIAFSGEIRQVVNEYLGSMSNKEYGYADLSEHPGRLEGMQPIIQAVGSRSSSSNGHYCDRLWTGEDLILDLYFKCGDLTLDYAAVGICNDMGERICTVGTHLSPTFDGTMTGEGVLRCRIPHLPLAEGDYSVMVAVGTRRPVHNMDYVEQALRFMVQTGDYFGTSYSLLRGQGPLVQHSHWEIVGED